MTLSPSFKERLGRELKNFAFVFVYIALVLSLFAVHKAFILQHNPLFGQLVALFNAFVLAKIIIVLEHFRVDQAMHHRLPILRIVLKSIVFGALLLVFHLLEEGVRGWFHGQAFGHALMSITEKRMVELVTLAIIMIVSLLPYFALREIMAVIGEKRMFDLLFRSSDKKPSPGDGSS